MANSSGSSSRAVKKKSSVAGTRPKQKKSNNGSQSEALVQIGSPDALRTLVGEMDSNIKLLQSKLDISIARVEEGLAISGLDSDVALAHDLLTQLNQLLSDGEYLFADEVERSLKMLSGDRKLRIKDLFRDQVRIAGRKRSIVPKTFKQKQYIEAIGSRDVVFGIGPAGTGKTYLAMAMAISELLKKNFKRVILCRPAVESGEKLGFLPGDMMEKVNPYLRPMYDALHDMVDFDRAQEMIDKGMVEVAPLAFMRGRTLSKAFVILDEGQNTTTEQMKMFLTRLGFGSKCVVTGDITQIDLPRGAGSGLVDAISVLRGVDEIAMIHFDKDDIIRHPLVSKIVAAYEDRDDDEV